MHWMNRLALMMSIAGIQWDPRLVSVSVLSGHLILQLVLILIFLECDRACKGCSGGGAAKCKECAENHFKEEAHCRGLGY